MARAKPRRPRAGFPWARALLILVAVTLVGSVVYLAQGGEIVIPFTDPPRTLSFVSPDKEEAPGVPEGKVAIPVTGRALAAYDAVVSEDVLDPRTGRKTVVYLDPDHARRLEVITDLRQIVGRVLRRDKSKGKVFRDSDFAPKGTRPGITAGTPRGKVAQRVELSKIPSFYGLKRGDHFDLVAAVAIDKDSVDQLQRLGGSYGDRMALEARMQNLDQQARIEVVVRDGVVVKPTHTRMLPVSNAAVQGTNLRQRPQQEIVVAVDPREVPRLLQALEVGATITCVAHSGLGRGAPSEIPTSEWDPWQRLQPGAASSGAVSFVETIRGTEKSVEPVPFANDRRVGNAGIAPASMKMPADAPGEETDD